MLFNYTIHFLVLYYFSSSSPPKVRGVREELKLFLFYFFISTFYRIMNALGCKIEFSMIL